ncbi:NADPH:quinone reductase-like Zn-dependent oxidoreductase [Nocardiopsis sp. Huas11]|uniref:zinc-binding dehydrogenase n=1 Tax=Nocardiopsis sp. Huas11 TaxID=2183912 RepID=UPI000EB2E973|nr:zinc-binding dehydrogenase [Nocardiopsis sp. Huas11]RKS05659.1 NADPH:quinone reductase-like Zn-dependent oxidoreductase [Nocardiopsis sp. Huas11]
MFAITAARISPDDPVSGLEAGERPEPEPREGWAVVDVRAASLNHHDLWSLRGVGLDEKSLPRILGSDAAGVDEDGNEVILHSVIGDLVAGGGNETLDPRRSLLSEVHEGTFAEKVLVPRRNLLPKPPELSFEEAACLPTAWLTAYSMLFGKADLRPGSTILVQGAGGGVAAALIRLAAQAGHRVYATSRSEAKRDRAVALGAHAAVPTGERLPERVDAVFDSVGQATWAHSVRSLKPGGAIITCGATSGDAPSAELTRVFFLQLRVLGSTMGSRAELATLTEMCVRTGLRPDIDRVLPLDRAREGFQAMADGDLFGKIVFTV